MTPLPIDELRRLAEKLDKLPMKAGEVRRARYSGRLHRVLYVDPDIGKACVAPLDAIDDDSWDDAEKLAALWPLVEPAPVDVLSLLDLLQRYEEALTEVARRWQTGKTHDICRAALSPTGEEK